MAGKAPELESYRLMPGEWLASLPPDWPGHPDGEGSLESGGHCVCQEGAFLLREYEMSLGSDDCLAKEESSAAFVHRMPKRGE